MVIFNGRASVLLPLLVLLAITLTTDCAINFGHDRHHHHYHRLRHQQNSVDFDTNYQQQQMLIQKMMVSDFF